MTTQKRMEEIFEKADIQVSDLQTDGGYLNPTQSSRFIQKLQDQPTLLKEVRLVEMPAPTMEINKIEFGSRVLHVAPSGATTEDRYLAAASRAEPTTDKITLTTKEFLCEMHIPYTVVEDNIEKGQFQQTCLSMLEKRISLDLEENIVLGDTGSGDADLAVFDGIIKAATTTTVDMEGEIVGLNTFNLAFQALADKYKANPLDLKFYSSRNIEAQVRYNTFASRQTILGDSSIQNRDELRVLGYKLEPASKIPNANLLFMDANNVILGVQRAISFETDRDIRARSYIVVVTLRIDLKIQENDAIVKVTNLAIR